MSTDEYVPSDEEMIHWFEGEENPELARDLWNTWLAAHDARVRRDAWDACYRQMVTAPARGVTVTEKSNPYAPERRVTP